MQTALRLFIVLASVLLCSSSFATKYIFTGSGDWKDPNNWEGGIIAPAILGGKDTLIINGICVNEPLQLDEFDYQDVFSKSNGIIIINANASLTLKNYTQFQHHRHMDIYGTLVIQTTFEAYFTDTIIVHNGGVFQNEVYFGNQGYMEIKDGGTVINKKTFDNDMDGFMPARLVLKNGGTITNIEPGTLIMGEFINEGGEILNTAVLKGEAVIEGDLVNGGTLAPGNSPGSYSITGDYIATPEAVHLFEVEGFAAGQYDVLQVNGTALLKGKLNITAKVGLSWPAGTEVPIITGLVDGTFSQVTLPDGVLIEYKTNSVILKPATPLPVHFIALDAKAVGNNLKLNWVVADEKNVIRYEVERSANGTQYYKVGIVNAAAQNSYSYLDAKPTDKVYYRVKSVDEDGKTQYSQIIFVKGDEGAVLLHAFKMGSEIVLQHRTVTSNTKISIYSVEGHLLHVVKAVKGTQQTKFIFPKTNTAHLFITLQEESGILETIKIINQ